MVYHNVIYGIGNALLSNATKNQSHTLRTWAVNTKAYTLLTTTECNNALSYGERELTSWQKRVYSLGMTGTSPYVSDLVFLGIH